MPRIDISKPNILKIERGLAAELKRLEQERDELKQENERLKEAYNEVSNNSEILHENHRLRIANAKLSEDLEQHGISIRAWRDESLKYKSALEEIRIYINRCRNSLCDSNCEYWNNCKGNYNIDNILTKINEVLK